MFEPSTLSDTTDAPSVTATAPATTAASPGLFSQLETAVKGQASNVSNWSAIVNAISDPRERVATLKAKIKNYKAMKAKYGIGPIGDLYQNQIVLMQSRLKAEEKDLELEREGETSTSTWRTIGHSLGYAGIAIAVLGGMYLGVKTYREATAPRIQPAVKVVGP